MNVVQCKPEELEGILNNLSYVRMQFEQEELWDVKPVFMAYDNIMEFVADEKERVGVEEGQKVLCKCQDKDFEYVLAGYIKHICSYNPSTVSVAFTEAQKFLNVRKYPRYEVSMKGMLYDAKDQMVECSIRNISRGGIGCICTTRIDIPEEPVIEIILKEGDHIKISTQVIRKIHLESGVISLGIQFKEVENEVQQKLDAALERLEAEFEEEFPYAKYVSIPKEERETTIDTKVLLISQDALFRRIVKKQLLVLGVAHIEIVPHFKFFINFFEKEQTKIVLIDLDKGNEETEHIIEKISSVFPNMPILAFKTFSGEEVETYSWSQLDNVHILYKPLIQNELEDMIAKYL